MKKNYLPKKLCMLAFGLSSALNAQVVTQTLSYTGATQTLNIPGCAQVTVTCYGAKGGNGAVGLPATSIGGTGGLGSLVSGVFNTPGVLMNVYVGGVATGSLGGFNGGGNGGSTNAGGGGGASDVRIGGTALANRIITAAGGGGGGTGGSYSAGAIAFMPGGNGGNGGNNGNNGTSSSGGGGGFAGTSSSGGLLGVGCSLATTFGFAGTSGTISIGGNGGNGASCCSAISPGGGGGGGGFIGGGGAGGGSAGTSSCTLNDKGAGGGGAGGSNFLSSTLTSTLVTNGSNSGNGYVVISYSLLPGPTIIVNNGSICTGNSFTINASGASTYTYSSGSNVVSPIANTNYTVTGTDALGCTNSVPAVSSVTVNALPTISINSGAICSGNSFTMSPTGASTYTYSNGNNIVSPTANTSYTINGTNANGCIGNTISSVTVNALPNVTVNSSTVCAGQTDLLIANGASTYTWSTAATTSSVFVTPTTNTMYVVTGTDANGCSNSATATAVVNANPTVIAVSNNSLICVGQSVIITPSGAVNYNITGGTFTISPTTTTNYTVSGVGANGCIASTVLTQSVSTCTGIDNLSLNNQQSTFHIYPNPSSGILNVELEMINENTKIEITNALGQVVMNEKLLIQHSTFNIQHFISGVYFVKVTSNNKQTTKRIILNR